MNIDKGEIVYCNINVQYKIKNRDYKKILNNIIFSRPYDDNEYPNLDVIKYLLFINKIDRKKAYYITNVKIVDLYIIARTGFIAKFNR